MILFSQRHREAIENKKMNLSITKKIRQKLIYCIKDCDYVYGDFEECSFLDDLKLALMKSYGETSLKAFVDDEYKEVDNIDQFISSTRPGYVLDLIELCGDLINGKLKEKNLFYKKCNQVFLSENSSFRFLDGAIVILDSTFLESEVLNKAYELLKGNTFTTACTNFLTARNNLTAGDYAGVITEACNSIESTLKKILNLDRCEQGKLKSFLMQTGLIPDYFQGFCDHYVNFLQSAFTIANNSSRHGQKEIPNKKEEVDFAVASFFLHLTGTLIVFLMERYQENS
jgi:hypothetical protein